MLLSIELNGKFGLCTEEVQAISEDGILTAKLES